MLKTFLLSTSLLSSVIAFPKSMSNLEKDEASKSKKEITDTKKEETKPKEDEKPKLTFTGYLDTYYFGNLNNPASRSNLGTSGLSPEGKVIPGNARAFEQRSGQFSLGLIQTKMVYSFKNVEAVADLTFGPNADLGNYGNLIGPLGSTTSLAIKLAYINLKATDKLTFTAGQFGTHIGYEVIDAPINYHYSLSNLFNNGPFYHVGLKANYAFSDKAAFMLGIVNNIDNLNDNNRQKGLISQLFLAPVSGWTVYVNWMGSNEAPAANDGNAASGNYYSLFDLTTSYQISPKFFMGLNAAYGSQSSKQGSVSASGTWGGVAVYTNYAISDKFGLGARYEVFDNKDGARGLYGGDGLGTTVNSFTLTGNISVAGGTLLLKPELRIDSYPKVAGGVQKFEDSKGAYTQSSQTTLGMAAIIKFGN